MLPPDLIRLVWKTTIQQRIAYEKQHGAEDKEAQKKAYTEILDQLDNRIALRQAHEILYRARATRTAKELSDEKEGKRDVGSDEGGGESVEAIRADQ